MTWTVIRGASADGAVEWEEKFWETSDAFTYRELGAVKSGATPWGRPGRRAGRRSTSTT